MIISGHYIYFGFIKRLIGLILISSLTSCSTEHTKECIRVDSEAILNEVLQVIEGPVTIAYGGPGSNFSFPYFVATHNVQLKKCDGLVYATFIPGKTSDGSIVIGPTIKFGVDVEKKLIVSEEWL